MKNKNEEIKENISNQNNDLNRNIEEFENNSINRKKKEKIY